MIELIQPIFTDLYSAFNSTTSSAESNSSSGITSSNFTHSNTDVTEASGFTSSTTGSNTGLTGSTRYSSSTDTVSSYTISYSTDLSRSFYSSTTESALDTLDTIFESVEGRHTDYSFSFDTVFAYTSSTPTLITCYSSTSGTASGTTSGSTSGTTSNSDLFSGPNQGSSTGRSTGSMSVSFSAEEFSYTSFDGSGITNFWSRSATFYNSSITGSSTTEGGTNNTTAFTISGGGSGSTTEHSNSSIQSSAYTIRDTNGSTTFVSSSITNDTTSNSFSSSGSHTAVSTWIPFGGNTYISDDSYETTQSDDGFDTTTVVVTTVSIYTGTTATDSNLATHRTTTTVSYPTTSRRDTSFVYTFSITSSSETTFTTDDRMVYQTVLVPNDNIVQLRSDWMEVFDPQDQIFAATGYWIQVDSLIDFGNGGTFTTQTTITPYFFSSTIIYTKYVSTNSFSYSSTFTSKHDTIVTTTVTDTSTVSTGTSTFYALGYLPMDTFTFTYASIDTTTSTATADSFSVGSTQKTTDTAYSTITTTSLFTSVDSTFTSSISLQWTVTQGGFSSFSWISNYLSVTQTFQQHIVDTNTYTTTSLASTFDTSGASYHSHGESTYDGGITYIKVAAVGFFESIPDPVATLYTPFYAIQGFQIQPFLSASDQIHLGLSGAPSVYYPWATNSIVPGGDLPQDFCEVFAGSKISCPFEFYYHKTTTTTFIVPFFTITVNIGNVSTAITDDSWYSYAWDYKDSEASKLNIISVSSKRLLGISTNSAGNTISIFTDSSTFPVTVETMGSILPTALTSWTVPTYAAFSTNTRYFGGTQRASFTDETLRLSGTFTTWDSISSGQIIFTDPVTTTTVNHDNVSVIINRHASVSLYSTTYRDISISTAYGWGVTNNDPHPFI